MLLRSDATHFGSLASHFMILAEMVMVIVIGTRHFHDHGIIIINDHYGDYQDCYDYHDCHDCNAYDNDYMNMFTIIGIEGSLAHQKLRTALLGVNNSNLKDMEHLVGNFFKIDFNFN